MGQPFFNSPIHWSATEIARRIAAREISALEVTKAFIARIEEVNPALNAVVVPQLEQALRDAAALDEQLARHPATAGQASSGTHGPARGGTALLGVPITLKECFHLAATPSTIGLDSAAMREPIHEDGILTQRLRRAGAIVLGKTNVPQLMIWHETDNPVYGRTNNPWDPERTPGGSGGGEAAIIAARGSPLGLGNDLGGSIRVPCHFCGIHGIKPTSFRLPRSGTRSTLRGLEAIVTQPGPMARHVEDLWLALQVLADDSDGHIAGDVAPGKFGDPAEVDISKLRVAAFTDDGVFPASPAIARAVREAAKALQTRGAEVVVLDASQVESVLGAGIAFDLYCSLVGADGGADARRLSRGSRLDWRASRLIWLAGLAPPVRALVSSGLSLMGQRWMARIVASARPRSADGYWQLVHYQRALAGTVLRNLNERGIQAIICPPHALPAMPHVAGFNLLPAASYAFLFNLLGLPAGVVSTTRVRLGEDSGRPDSRDEVLRLAQAADRGSVGLPIGVQVAALPWREEIVLAVMRVLEEASRENADYPSHVVVPVGAEEHPAGGPLSRDQRSD